MGCWVAGGGGRHIPRASDPLLGPCLASEGARSRGGRLRSAVTWHHLEFTCCDEHGASLVAQMVKKLPAMWETWVQSLGWEDPLEREWPLKWDKAEG